MQEVFVLCSNEGVPFSKNSLIVARMAVCTLFQIPSLMIKAKGYPYDAIKVLYQGGGRLEVRVSTKESASQIS